MITESEIEQPKVKDRTLVRRLSESLAEPFGIKNQQLIDRVTRVNRHFDVFVHQLDDVKDNPENVAAIAHEAVTNLIKGIQYIQDVEQKDILFGRLFGYWKQASDGEKHLWRHHGVVSAYNEMDFLMLGKRGSMAKVPIALYADASQDDSPVKKLEEAVEEAGTAVQLCDDIFDWQVDLRSGIYTHPIVLAHDKIGSLDEVQIERTLFSPEVLTPLTNRANKYLASARKKLEQTSANKLDSYLKEMTESLEYLIIYSRELEQEGIQDGIFQRIREKTSPLLVSH